MAKNFYKKIVVAVNGSQSSIHAAMYAVMLCKTYNIELKAVYVVDTATIKYLSTNRFLIAEEKMDFETQLHADGEKYLNYVEMLGATKGLKIQKELRSGGVFTEILRSADEFEADLILLGGYEKEKSNSIKRPVLSVSQAEILANSKCPVMLVQQADIEAKFKIF